MELSEKPSKAKEKGELSSDDDDEDNDDDVLLSKTLVHIQTFS